MASWKRVITTSDDSDYKNSNIQEASSSARGGVKIGYTESGKNYPVELDNGQMYVNVPWTDTDTDTNTFRTVKVTDSSSSQSTLGATTALELEAGSNVELAEADGVVTISATDTNTVYTLPTATATVKGGIELASNTSVSTAIQSISTTSNRYYGIQLNSDGQAVVNVPWSDTNTDTNTFRTIKFDTTGDGTANSTLGTTSNLELYGGGGISLTHSGTDVTISAGSTIVKTSGNQTIGGVKTFSSNVTVQGNLTVSGTTTTVNTEEIKLADNVIVLNSNKTGTPNEDAGIEIERGDRTNTFIQWDEDAYEWVGRIQGSSANDTTGYTGRVAFIERASGAGTSGSINTVGAMFINTDTSNIYIYS